MSAAKAKKKSTKPKKPGPGGAKGNRPAQQSVRAFRFNAAQTVQIHFAGEKKPESFRVDDMSEATLATLDGQTRPYFQYRLVSNDKKGEGGSDRCYWFFDPKPVGSADPIDPSLWRVVDEQPPDGAAVVKSHSGQFSTRSVTSYDGSGSRHVVQLDGMPSYRMRLDLNGKREFGQSLPVTIRKGDVLSVPRS